MVPGRERPRPAHRMASAMEGLVHRGIKPGNILLEESGKLFVVDFGLALRELEVGKEQRYAGTPGIGLLRQFGV